MILSDTVKVGNYVLNEWAREDEYDEKLCYLKSIILCKSIDIKSRHDRFILIYRRNGSNCYDTQIFADDFHFFGCVECKIVSIKFQFYTAVFRIFLRLKKARELRKTNQIYALLDSSILSLT